MLAAFVRAYRSNNETHKRSRNLNGIDDDRKLDVSTGPLNSQSVALAALSHQLLSILSRANV